MAPPLLAQLFTNARKNGTRGASPRYEVTGVRNYFMFWPVVAPCCLTLLPPPYFALCVYAWEAGGGRGFCRFQAVLRPPVTGSGGGTGGKQYITLERYLRERKYLYRVKVCGIYRENSVRSENVRFWFHKTLFTSYKHYI